MLPKQDSGRRRHCWLVTAPQEDLLLCPFRCRWQQESTAGPSDGLNQLRTDSEMRYLRAGIAAQCYGDSLVWAISHAMVERMLAKKAKRYGVQRGVFLFN